VAAFYTRSSSLPDMILHLLNNTLVTLYTKEQDTRTAFKIITLVNDVLTNLPPPNVVSFISTLEKGLNHWLNDSDEVVPDDDYNAYVRIPLVFQF
jgi:hypothetical protein